MSADVLGLNVNLCQLLKTAFVHLTADGIRIDVGLFSKVVNTIIPTSDLSYQLEVK
jgi:hypothetical protein